MALTIMGRDEWALGTWQVDYDTIGLTIGHTCTTTDPNAKLVLTVTEVFTTGPNAGQPTGWSFSKDVSGDFGKGRVVDRSNVPNSAIPVHVKGDIYPLDFDSSWTP